MTEQQNRPPRKQREPSDPIIVEAQKMRDHELAMAKVNAERDAKLAGIAAERALSRRYWIAGMFGIIAGLAVALAIIYAVWSSSADDRRKNAEIRIHQTDVAKTCIQEGNIWYDGNCLLTRRTG